MIQNIEAEKIKSVLKKINDVQVILNIKIDIENIIAELKKHNFQKNISFLESSFTKCNTEIQLHLEQMGVLDEFNNIKNIATDIKSARTYWKRQNTIERILKVLRQDDLESFKFLESLLTEFKIEMYLRFDYIKRDLEDYLKETSQTGEKKK